METFSCPYRETEHKLNDIVCCKKKVNKLKRDKRPMLIHLIHHLISSTGSLSWVSSWLEVFFKEKIYYIHMCVYTYILTHTYIHVCIYVFNGANQS